MTIKPTYEELENRINNLEEEISKHKRTEKLLQEREARFRRMANQVPEVLYQFVMHQDGSFSIPFINDRIYEFAGYRPEEIMEEPNLMANNIHPDDISLMQDGVKQSAESLTGFSVEHRLIDHDKGIKWVQAKATPQLMKDGNIHWDGISIDITERKQSEEALQESENKYHKLFEKMMDGCVLNEIICDKNGKPVNYRFLDINPAFEKLTGHKRSDLLGKTILEIVPNMDPFLIETYGKVALTGKPISFYYYTQETDKHHEITVYQPEERQFAFIFQDVTERKKAEEELQQSQNNLEQRVKERTEELRKANKALHNKTNDLQDLNTALKVLLDKREQDKDDIGQKVLLNVKELLIPYINKLKKCPLSERQESYFELLEAGLRDIISPFAQKLTSRYMHITPGQMKVANLVKEGKTSKEIAEILNSTERAVVAHRAKLRKKLGLDKKSNLRTYLLSIQ